MSVRALLSVEARRFGARRLIRWSVAAVVLAILISALLAFSRSHRPTAEDLAEADRTREQVYEDCLTNDFLPPGVPEEDRPQECLAVAEEIAARQLDTFHLADLQDIYIGTAVPLFLLAWLLASSFIGAEWHAGTVATLLTWEPRRLRVLLTKATVTVVAAFVGTVTLQALLGLALWPAAAFRGTTAGIDAGWFARTTEVVLRGAAVSAVMATFGFALASMARNTAAALGVGFGYLVVVENLIAGLRPGWRSWLLIPNVVTVLIADPDFEEFGRSITGASVLLAAYAVGILLLAAVLFRARDVT